MEILVAVLAELLLALVLSSALLLAGGLLLGVYGLLAALFWSARRRRGGRARPWMRWSRGTALALLVGVIVALTLLQTVLLAPALRQLCAGLEQQSGLELRFKSVDAAVLRGQLTLRELELTRRGDDGAEAVALTIAEAELDLDLLSLVPMPGQQPKTRALERVAITGIKGQLTQAGDRERGRERPDEDRRPPFVIRSLELRDVALELRADDKARTLAIPRLTVQPLRSDHVIYDLLFHADGKGSLGLVAFQVERAAAETRWTFRDLPMERLRERFAELAIGLSGGTVDVTLAAREQPTPQLELGVTLQGLQVSATEDAGRGKRAAAALLSLAMRARGPTQFSFTIDIDPARYEQASTLAETGLRDDIVLGFKNALGSLAGSSLERGLNKDPPGALRRRAGEFVKDRAKDAIKRRLEGRRDEGSANAPPARRP